ncbi:hypothetical protein [Leifsonia sp. A12D58]|uniref:hypothetical protein n=1 Tax=Leifsonia sp. A12D58 TaxID=3397674 RepID=UPI0039E0946E
MTFALVPLGILLHYWRKADQVLLASTSMNQDEVDWSHTISRQVLYARIASGISVAVAIVFLDRWLPSLAELYDPYSLHEYVLPLVTSIVSICVVMLAHTTLPPLPGERVHAVDLSSRSLWSFGERWWFILWGVLVTLLIATVVLAGLSSSTEMDGRSAALMVQLGSSTASGTFLGWYFGVPILIGAAALVLATVLTLWANARQPVAVAVADRAVDVWLRRYRTRTILTLSGGALALVLGSSLILIGAGGSITLQVAGGNQLGTITVSSAISALVVPFRLLGMFFKGVGLALLILPLLTRRPRLVLTTLRGQAINDQSLAHELAD